MKYKVKMTTKFRKNYKTMKKRGLNMKLLKEVIEKLAEGDPLPIANRDHALTGNFSGYRECHIQPDWLLIYQIEEDILVLTLTQTGSHSDLFK